MAHASTTEMPFARSCDATLPITRIDAPSRAVFERRFLETQTPVVVRGVVPAWPASRVWTPEYLKNRVGTRSIRVSRAHRDVHFLGDGRRIMDYEPMRFADYVEQVESGAAAANGLYASVVPLTRTLPELMDDLRFPDYFERRDCPTPNLWFGPGGNVSPLHYDTTHNFLAQVRGHKTVLLMPPAELRHVYPHRTPSHSLHVSRVNVMHPDLERFPKVREARAMLVTLQPGEMLFIPLFWWHAVAGSDINLSINFWWRTPLSHYARYPRHVVRGAFGLGANAAAAAAKSILSPRRTPRPA